MSVTYSPAGAEREWPLDLPELQGASGLAESQSGLPGADTAVSELCLFDQLAFFIKSIVEFCFDLSEKGSQREKESVKQTNRNTTSPTLPATKLAYDGSEAADRGMHLGESKQLSHLAEN